MNERQFNAIRACEQSAAQLAEKRGLRRPSFMFQGGDMAIEFWKAVDSIAVFLDELAAVDVQEQPEEPEEEVAEKQPVQRKKKGRA